jgi:hypothetical protein
MREQSYIANIECLLNLVSEEFSGARQLLTKVTNEESATLASLTTALQSQDILSQRIQHLIDGFKCSEAYFEDKKFKNSFLDLQYFQLVTIAWDLDKAISELKKLAAGSTSKHGKHVEGSTVFPRYAEIVGLFRVLNRTSVACVAHRILSGVNPFNSNQAAECIGLYTMQCERLVLQWFQSNMPFGKRNDLLRVYAQNMNDENESVELF